MKKFTSIPVLFSIISVLLLFGACCPVTVIVGSGKLVTENETYSDFTNVSAGSAFAVNITQDEEYSITITADNNLMPHVRVSMDANTLNIDTDVLTMTNVTLIADITMPDIDELNLTGATHGTLDGFDTSETLSSLLSGASRLTFDDITYGDVDIDVSGASTIDGTLNCGDIDLNLSGASTADLEGQAADAVIVADDASGVLLGDFTVANADVNLCGASSGTVIATGTIDVNLSGASSLQYSGTLGEENITGASTISEIT